MPMTREEIAKLATAVLQKHLSQQGFDHAEVTEGHDHSDIPALFIKAVLKPGATIISGAVSSAANTALSNALLAGGEERFPYVRIEHPDDERPEDYPRRSASK